MIKPDRDQAALPPPRTLIAPSISNSDRKADAQQLKRTRDAIRQSRELIERCAAWQQLAGRVTTKL